MANDTFTEILPTLVADFAERYGLAEHEAFVALYANWLLETVDPAEVVEGLCGRAGDKGLDGIWVDNTRGVVVLVQGDYARGKKGKDTTHLANKLSRLITLAGDLMKPGTVERLYREDSPLKEAAELLQSHVEDGFAVEAHLVYPGPALAALRREAAERSNGVTAKAISAEELKQARARFQSVEKGHCRVTSGELRVVDAMPLGPAGDGYRAIVPAETVHALFQKHGTACFGENIRIFQQAPKGSVNSSVKATLIDRPEEFYYCNNGLAVIADDVDYDAKRGVLTLREFSIINGCQTASVIGGMEAGHPSLGKAFVGVDVLRPAPKSVTAIIQARNSQTRVKDQDLASRHPRLKTLHEQLLDLVPRPWYLELRKGEFGRQHRNRLGFFENGVWRLIDLKRLAFGLACFNGLWPLAYAKSGKLFNQDNFDRVFTPETTARDVLWGHTLFAAASEYCKEYRKKLPPLPARFASAEEEVAKRRAHSLATRNPELPMVTVMRTLIERRHGEDVITTLPTSAFSEPYFQDALARYAALAFDLYRKSMRDLVSNAVEHDRRLKSERTAAELAALVDEHLAEERMSDQNAFDSLPRLDQAPQSAPPSHRVQLSSLRPVGAPVSLDGRGGIKAYGQEYLEGFLVKKGAVCKGQVGALHDSYKAVRDAMLTHGALVPTPDGEALELVEDYLFTKPSSAQAVILGYNPNTVSRWKPVS